MSNDIKPNDDREQALNSRPAVDASRRKFLTSTAGIGAATMAASLGSSILSPQAVADDFSAMAPDPSLGGSNRAMRAAELKKQLANEQLFETLGLPNQLDNNDEHRYREQRFYASFHKSLPQNNFGEVDPQAFDALRQAMRVGSQSAFDAIPLAINAERKLVHPQGALRFEMTGLDSHATRMAPAPTFRSAVAAAEMGEVYWQALTRDLPFINYSDSLLIEKALNDLNNFSNPVGPKQNNLINANTLFRGETPGDLNGPYISQLLLMDVPYGPSNIVQRYSAVINDLDYMVSESHWLHVQRGGSPLEDLILDPNPRYINNNRALSEYVHKDVLFQAYFNAALILLSLGSDALDPGNAYLFSDNQDGFSSLGGPWLLQRLTYAANLGLSGAWFQKWRVHRRLRPETFGGRIHFMLKGLRQYEIHPDILNSAAVSKTQSEYGTSLLPMAYTEGSPVHPAYPAGHASVAGACCTLLKAFFNEDYIFPNPVQANASGSALLSYDDSALTLGGEINKLANNIAIGRDAAGVHYRSDGIDGLEVGEQQAIRLLRDHVKTLNEDFAGFNLTKFNGQQINISKP